MRSMIFLLVVAALPAQAADRTETEIRTLRAANNAALVAHDFAAMRRHYLPDYTTLPGSSGTPFTVEQVEKRLAPAFADPTFLTYVRTPTRITIAATGKRAAEVGTWAGTWSKPDGVMRLTGIYQAMWLPTPAGWRLKNESFVSLKCVGSKDCANVE